MVRQLLAPRLMVRWCGQHAVRFGAKADGSLVHASLWRSRRRSSAAASLRLDCNLLAAVGLARHAQRDVSTLRTTHIHTIFFLHTACMHVERRACTLHVCVTYAPHANRHR